MNFSRLEENLWPLSGRTCGFGKVGWGEGVHYEFSEGREKHLACPATDVLELWKKRVHNEFSHA